MSRSINHSMRWILGVALVGSLLLGGCTDIRRKAKQDDTEQGGLTPTSPATADAAQDEPQTDAPTGDEAAAEEPSLMDRQPSVVKRFLRRYQRKATMEAQKQIVGKENVSRLRKLNRYYKKLERQINVGGDIVETPYETQRQLREGQEVFGWHPYFMGNAWESYDFKLLTHLAYFAYDIDPETGNYRSDYPIEDWKTSPMIDSAKAQDCKVLLTITNHGSRNNALFLGNLAAQQMMIDSVMQLLALRQAHGVNLNFEMVPSSAREDLTTFVITFANILHKSNPDYLVTMTLPAVDHAQAYDIRTLLPYVDRFVIMGYDYHSGSSTTPGPVAPLPPEGKIIVEFNLANTLETYITAGLPQNKTIMALPYYGRLWQAENARMSPSIFKEALTYRVIKNEIIPKHTPVYDSLSSSWYVQYMDSLTGYHYELWYDDERSLAVKYDWLLRQRVRGVGIWALGYDNGYTDLWALLDQKMTEDVTPPVSSQTISARLRNQAVYLNTAIVFLLFFIFGGLAFAVTRPAVSGRLLGKSWFLGLYVGLMAVFAVLALQFAGVVQSDAWWYVGGVALGYIGLTFLPAIKVKPRQKRLP